MKNASEYFFSPQNLIG